MGSAIAKWEYLDENVRRLTFVTKASFMVVLLKNEAVLPPVTCEYMERWPEMRKTTNRTCLAEKRISYSVL